MPLYEYQCENCGEVFELMQKFSDEPLTTHEKCGGKVNRLISAPALQFKGSGWYVTDYAKSGSSPGNGGSTAKKDGDSASASSSSEKGKDSGSSSGSTSSDSSKGSSTTSTSPATTSSDKK